MQKLRVFARSKSGSLQHFACATAGATAVEFALLLAPFLALAFAIIQTGIVYFAGQALETAAAKSSRFILTGQAQMQGWSAAQFRSQVCTLVTGLFNCGTSVYVDVENYSSFASANMAMPITNGVFNTGSFGFNPGGPGDVVVLRLYYQYPIFASGLGVSLSNLNGGYNLLAATAVFKNEPYNVN
jgi:Flp pilus assembly protein TadG